MYTFDIVDDHKMFGEAVGKYLTEYNSKLKLGKVFQSAHEYLVYLHTHPTKKPDVVMIDYRMRGLLGWHLSQILERDFSNIKKIGFSGDDIDDWINNFFLADCKAFVCKDNNCQELANAIEEVAKGNYYYNSYLEKNTIPKKRSIEETEYLHHLTANEFFYLHLCQTDLTNKLIATILGLKENTLHKKQSILYKKFEVKTKGEMVRYAIDKRIIKYIHIAQ